MGAKEELSASEPPASLAAWWHQAQQKTRHQTQPTARAGDGPEICTADARRCLMQAELGVHPSSPPPMQALIAVSEKMGIKALTLLRSPARASNLHVSVIVLHLLLAGVGHDGGVRDAGGVHAGAQHQRVSEPATESG